MIMWNVHRCRIHPETGRKLPIAAEYCSGGSRSEGPGVGSRLPANLSEHHCRY